MRWGREGIAGGLALGLGLTLTACGGPAHAGPTIDTSASTVASTVTTTSKPPAPPKKRRHPATTTTTSTTAPASTVPPTSAPPSTTPSGFTTTYTKPAPPPPALPQPTASRPLTILEVGDSLGIDLGWGLDAVFGSDRYVRVVTDAVGDTGLARPDYYDWPQHLSQELAEYHPGAVVVMLGGNDAQDFVDGGRYVSFGSSLWHTIYSERVGNFMNEAMEAGAHVFWVGMPVMGTVGFSDEMALENQAYSQQAALRQGVDYFSSWNVFTNSAGQYAEYLPNPAGQLVEVRDSDGVHLTYDGADRLASAMLGPMQQAFGVKLFR